MILVFLIIGGDIHKLEKMNMLIYIYIMLCNTRIHNYYIYTSGMMVDVKLFVYLSI